MERQPGTPNDLFRPPVPITLTPEAKAIVDDWYAKRVVDGESARLDSYLHRLLLLTSLSLGHVKEIGAEAAQCVVQLLNWQHRVRRAYAPSQALNPVAAMEQRIRQALAHGPVVEKGRKGLMQRVLVERHGLYVYELAKANLQKFGEISTSATSEKWVSLVSLISVK